MSTPTSFQKTTIWQPCKINVGDVGMKKHYILSPQMSFCKGKSQHHYGVSRSPLHLQRISSSVEQQPRIAD
jgi:hypothetical protein